MERRVSNLSYESFKSDLQRKTDENESPKIVNSTMVKDGEPEVGNSGGNANKQKIAASAINGKRKLIKLPLPYRCRDCGKEFREIANLRVHFMKHLSGGGKENEKPPYLCRHQGCGRDFFNEQDRKYHEIRHVTKGNFNCERIQKTFKYK